MEFILSYLESRYHVGAVFLQKPSRVKAFAYVMLTSLFLYCALEYLLLMRMATETEPLKPHGKRQSLRPTVAPVLEMLDEMRTMHVNLGDAPQRMTLRPHYAPMELVLGLLDMDLSIYTTVQKSASLRQHVRNFHLGSLLGKIALSSFLMYTIVWRAIATILAQYGFQFYRFQEARNLRSTHNTSALSGGLRYNPTTLITFGSSLGSLPY